MSKIAGKLTVKCCFLLFSKILLRRFPGRSAPTAVREPEPCGDLNICNAKTSSSKTCVYEKEKITRNIAC